MTVTRRRYDAVHSRPGPFKCFGIETIKSIAGCITVTSSPNVNLLLMKECRCDQNQGKNVKSKPSDCSLQLCAHISGRVSHYTENWIGLVLSKLSIGN